MKKLICLFLISALAVMSSCRKEEADETSFPGNTNSAQVNATISGRVVDETGVGLQGVNVSAYGITTTTDANGIFLIEGNVEKKRCVLEFNKPGYMKRLHAIIPSSTTVNYVKIILQDEPSPQNFQSANGGSIALDHGGSVAFPSNSFVIQGTSTVYNGLVTIYSKHISPDNSDFSMLIPGGDLAALDADGKSVSLYSYGMASVTIQGSGGENLQLASGTAATITFPIATTQSASAPQSIPMWYLDEEDALWKEEGQAIKVGNNYVGNVSHFTWWNCDYSGPKATVTGRVVDCEGTPLANVTVTINGGITVTTNGNGFYTTWVPSGWALDFQVLPQGTISLPSQLENVAPLMTGQSYTVLDLIVPCGPRITGHVTGCEGEAISGNVYLTTNGQFIANIFTSDGSFDIMCLPSTNYEVHYSSSSGYFQQSITTPPTPIDIDLGTIQLCSQSSGSTSFTINGGIFNNDYVELLNPAISTAQYRVAEDITQVLIFGSNTSLGTLDLSMQFTGNQPVNVDFNDSLNESLFHLSSANGLTIYPSMAWYQHFYLNVTEYEAVGDSIKGTFYGDVYYSSNGNTGTAYISNGTFAVARIPDF